MLALAAILDVVSSPFTLASLLLVLGLWVAMLRPDAHEIVGRVWRTASGRSTPSPANANPLMPGLLLIGLITCTFMLFFNLTNVLVRPGVRLGGQKLLCTRDVCSAHAPSGSLAFQASAWTHSLTPVPTPVTRHYSTLRSPHC